MSERREVVPAEIVQALPGLARVTASAWLNAAQWSVVTGWKLTRRLARAASDPAAANELAHELGLTAGVVVELARRVSEGANIPQALEELARATATHTSAEEPDKEGEEGDLRARGADLLRRSRDVTSDDAGHPAYRRILDELAPDEARIVVYLLREGAQPAVDVRTGGPVGLVSSRLVAKGLSMVGPRAGVRHPGEVPAYLNNLERLGLAELTGEPLIDPAVYQVLEAQPDVLAAMHSVRLPKVVRRSITLTPLGEEFCRAVLVPDEPS
ncbi:Abi-alpha family protein [Nocardioides mangrovicus]|uniref:Abi-alpha family protein n=1 Tax=Nocardioides mangrovicus TaxID=2478913 RepID=UPI0018E09C6F|nr:Abi-alpha family protein [Nocardioides mangrovicus]